MNNQILTYLNSVLKQHSASCLKHYLFLTTWKQISKQWTKHYRLVNKLKFDNSTLSCWRFSYFKPQSELLFWINVNQKAVWVRTNSVYVFIFIWSKCLKEKKNIVAWKKVIFVCKQNEKFRKIGNSAAFSLWPYTFEKWN